MSMLVACIAPVTGNVVVSGIIVGQARNTPERPKRRQTHGFLVMGTVANVGQSKRVLASVDQSVGKTAEANHRSEVTHLARLYGGSCWTAVTFFDSRPNGVHWAGTLGCNFFMPKAVHQA